MMEYNKEFEEAWEKEEFRGETAKSFALAVWQAARKDHYRIGEEVELKNRDGEWCQANIHALHMDGNYVCTVKKPDDVRRYEKKSRARQLAEEIFNHVNNLSITDEHIVDRIESTINQALAEREGGKS